MIRFRIPAIVLALAIMLTACARDIPDEPIVPGPIIEYSELLIDADYASDVSEAYLLERIHSKWGHNLAVVMGHLWYNAHPTKISTRTWPDDHAVSIDYNCGGKLKITFKHLAYDPELSKIHYGRTVIAQTLSRELDGHSYLYDLTQSEEPGHFNQTDSVSLEQSRSVTLTNSTDFNVTAQSETKVGGEFAGIGVEETITLATGLDLKSETQRAQSESTAKSSSHSFDIELSPLKATLITLSSTEVQSSTPFFMDAIASFSVELFVERHCLLAAPSAQFNEWLIKGGCWITDSGCGGTEHANLDWCYPSQSDKSRVPQGFISLDGCKFSFESIERVGEWLRGVHERWPGMGRWGQWVYAQCSKHHDCWSAYHSLTDPDARRIRLTGTQHRIYEDAVEQKVIDVTGQNVDDVLAKHSAKSCDPAEATCG